LPLPKHVIVHPASTAIAAELRAAKQTIKAAQTELLDIRSAVLALEALVEKSTRDGALHNRRRHTLNRAFTSLKQRLSLPPKVWSD
jgi:hypothetical protein